MPARLTQIIDASAGALRVVLHFNTQRGDNPARDEGKLRAQTVRTTRGNSYGLRFFVPSRPWHFFGTGKSGIVPKVEKGASVYSVARGWIFR